MPTPAGLLRLSASLASAAASCAAAVRSGGCLDLADLEPDPRVVVGDAPAIRQLLDEIEAPAAALRARLGGRDHARALVVDARPDAVGPRLHGQLDPALAVLEGVRDQL